MSAMREGDPAAKISIQGLWQSFRGEGDQRRC